MDDKRIAPVDAFEIPEHLRKAVRRASAYEMFPHTSTTSEPLDLDHIVADKFGRLWEPGQTNVHGLAPLGRLINRAKTLGVWKVRSEGLSELVWTSPLGRRWVVGARGTRPSATMIRGRAPPCLSSPRTRRHP